MSWKWTIAAAAVLAAPLARAHDFICTKTANGQSQLHVTTYPTTVTYVWTIENALSNEASTANVVTDTMFDDLGLTVPFTLQPGQTVTRTQELTIQSYEDCLGLTDDFGGSVTDGVVTLPNTLTIEHDAGSDVCSASVVCRPPGQPPGPGCLTRTPGYWGTHPEVTAEFLPVESCGLSLASTDPQVQGSITEDLCSVGTDHKVYGSPQVAQLVRQCAAAALNIAASADLEGSCSSFEPRFEECCSSCGEPGPGCIEDLDAFNNSADTLLQDGEEVSLCHALELSCAADSGACQASRGNGWVNARDTEEAGVPGSPATEAGVPGSGSPATEAGVPGSPATEAGAQVSPTSRAPETGSANAGGCSGGPGGLLALLATAGLLLLRRRA